MLQKMDEDTKTCLKKAKTKAIQKQVRQQLQTEQTQRIQVKDWKLEQMKINNSGKIIRR